MKLSDLKIRDKISCRISGGGGNVYHLRVEETIGNKFLLTDLPIISARKIRFKIGSIFDFLYTDETGIYLFTGKIVSENNSELMRISLEETEFNQIQRRAFFRLAVEINCGLISFKEFYKEEILYNSVNIEDISAQGMRLSSNKELKYEKGELVYIKSDFFNEFNGGLWAEIYKFEDLSDEEKDYKQTVIIKFILLSDSETENLVKLIFKKQREILKKKY